MAILDTKHKRKSAAITTLLVSLLVFVVFNFGMNYIDPPEEYGLAVNLVDLNVGSSLFLPLRFIFFLLAISFWLLAVR